MTDKINDMVTRLPAEILLQYETYSVWKKESEVTLEDFRKYGTNKRRWGNSSEGYLLSCCNTPLDDYKRCSECGEGC